MNRFYNSLKGEIFLRRLVQDFGYDDLMYQIGAKQTLTEVFKRQQNASKQHISLIYEAKKGSLKDIRRSIAQGRNVNYRDYDSRTALHLAANHGHFDVVKYLVNHGAVVTIKDRFEKTPIDDARENGHEEIAKFLEENA